MSRIRKRCGALVIAAAIALPASSSASPIRECGAHRPFVVNLTTRNTRCSFARWFSWRVTPSAHGYWKTGGGYFICDQRHTHFSPDFWDVRCTKASQVTQWQGRVHFPGG